LKGLFFLEILNKILKLAFILKLFSVAKKQL